MLRPLPVRVRAVHGETPESYASRLAAGNGVTSAELDRYLKEQGLYLTRAHRGDDFEQALRRLGPLSRDALTEQRFLEGQDLRTRPGCIRCSHGQAATVRLLDRGHVCLKHKWWFGITPQDVSGYPEVLVAERGFRRYLAARGALVDGHVMRIAGECADMARPLRGPRSVVSTAEASDDLRRYPVQVRIARILANGALMIPGTDPVVPKLDRRNRLVRAFTQAVGPADPSDVARGFNHMWRIVYDIERARREAAARKSGLDDPYEIIRLWNY